MDNYVITNFTNDFDGFINDFRTYITKCNSVSSEVAELIANRDRYKDMSVEEYYVERRLAYLKANPAECTLTNGVFVEDVERKRLSQEVLDSEVFTDDLRARYEQDLSDLQSGVEARVAEAAVKKAEAELDSIKAKLDGSIEKMSASNKEIMQSLKTAIDKLGVEKQELADKKKAEMRRLNIDDATAVKTFEEKYAKEVELFNKKVDLFVNLSDLVRSLDEELEDIKFRNANVKDAFDINFGEELDVVTKLQENLADLNLTNMASLDEVINIQEQIANLRQSVNDKKSENVVVEVIKTGDDEYSFFTRFGGLKHPPIEHLAGAALTEEFIKSTLASHITKFAIKTKFTEDEIKAKPYVVRVNGYIIGLNDEKKKGKFKLEEVPALISGADLGNTIGGPQQNDQGQLNPDGPQQNDQGQLNPDGPQQNDQGQLNPDGPQQNDQGQLNPDGPQPTGQGAGANLDSSDFDRNDKPNKPETKAHKVERIKRRNVKRALLSTLAGAGLFGVAAVGLATSPLIFIGAGAATLVGGVSGVQVILDAVRKKATMHKLKKLAQSVGGELKVYEDGSLRITSNYKGSVEPVESVDVQPIENDLGVNIQDELDRIVYANRVLKSDAPENSNKKLDFRGFEVTTPDNLERAFDEFGGLTQEDLGKISNFKYNVGRKNPFKKVGEAFTNLRDKVAERFGSDEDIDLTEEELEAARIAAEEEAARLAAEEAAKQEAARLAAEEEAARLAQSQSQEDSFEGMDISGANDKAASLDQDDLGFGLK